MNIKTNNTKTIFVGVSGGVDSSVAAALLKEQGHDVVGVFIRTWQPDWIECTWQDERRDAMRVCAHLNIPFKELDLEDAYKKGVADYMIAEYQVGRTPNPDVMCNKKVKFGAFLLWALEHGADAVATGHYAQNIFNAKTNLWELHRGKDKAKDQSYFLWTLTQGQLEHILFPVGHLEKSETRRLAEKYKLTTATKKDSQGICFIGQVSMKEFLGHYIEHKQGNVLDHEGVIIGHHFGALFFTIGERHGFIIDKKKTDDRPYYVISKNIANNTITVSQNVEAIERNKKIELTETVWNNTPPQKNKKYTGQIRYHGEEKEIFFRAIVDNIATIETIKNDPTITQGQSLVVYDGNICLGGGVINT